ncbi:hypothetical protein Mapa_016507 [Marchantia paleacea]|nr:hypothetical protein Mapa_016507 [Marchantia paleacea]
MSSLLKPHINVLRDLHGIDDCVVLHCPCHSSFFIRAGSCLGTIELNRITNSDRLS